MSRADELQANLVQARARALDAELALRRHDAAALVSENRRLKRENKALADENRRLKARHDEEGSRTRDDLGQGTIVDEGLEGDSSARATTRDLVTRRRGRHDEEGSRTRRRSHDGHEAARTVCRSGEEFFERLKGEWQSLQMGYIEVYAEEGMGMLVKTAGKDGALLGRLFASAEFGGGLRINLERSFFRTRAKTKAYHINGPESTAHRVVWAETMPLEDRSSSSSGPGGGRRCDVWNRSLIQEIRAAAEWVEQPPHHLHSDLHAGLGKLAKDELTRSPYTVALCTATKNRLWQLQHALPPNLLHCWPHREWVRIHIVDCDSTDGTLDWILAHCRAAIDVGLLVVYSTQGRMPFWHASVGKNTAHIVAMEDILVNVDGDNLVGMDFVVHVVQQFCNGYSVLQYEDGDGTCGRIACWREEFQKVRGYDENAYPMGSQDIDLIQRLKVLHQGSLFQKVPRRSFASQAIKNTVPQKISCCDPKFACMKWGQMDAKNRESFRIRREQGKLVRNCETNYGLATARVSPTPVLYEQTPLD